MSIKLMSIIFEMDFKNSNSKFVLLALADHENDLIDDRCFPSASLLSKKCSLSKSSVFRALNDLENLGYIKRINQKNNKNGNLSNLYKIILPYVFKMVEKGIPSVTQTLPLVSDRHPPSVRQTLPLVSQCDTNHKSLTIKESYIRESDIKDVFIFWQTATGKSHWGLTNERGSKIRSVLTKGIKYNGVQKTLSPEELKKMITQHLEDEWWVNQGLIDIPTIFTEKRITMFIEGRLNISHKKNTLKFEVV